MVNGKPARTRLMTMRVENLVKLAHTAARDKDELGKGAVGANGYGFVFKDPTLNSREEYVTILGSSKVCNTGSNLIPLSAIIYFLRILVFKYLNFNINKRGTLYQHLIESLVDYLPDRKGDVK